MNPPSPDGSLPFHFVVGDLDPSPVLPTIHDPEIPRVRVLVDGELAAHLRAHELAAELSELLAPHLRATGTALYLEVDDEAIRRGVSVRAATRLASDPMAAAAAAATEYLASWIGARGLGATGGGTGKAAE